MVSPNIIRIIALFFGSLALFWLDTPVFLRVVVGFAYLWGAGHIILRGQAWLPESFARRLLAPLPSILLIAVGGTAVYMTYALTTPVIIAVWALPILMAVGIEAFAHKRQEMVRGISPAQWSMPLLRAQGLWPLLLYALLWGTSFALVMNGATTHSVTGPWAVLGMPFFVSYGLTTLALIMGCTSLKKPAWIIVMLGAYFYLSLSILQYVFPLSYGFDPFIHQATEALILEKGVALPKTPYYIGYYAIVVVLHAMTGVSIGILDQYLVPIVASVGIPALAYHTLGRVVPAWPAGVRGMAIASLLLIPFTPLVSATPWGLAAVLLALFGVLALLWVHTPSRGLLIACGSVLLAIVALHPIIGIPALCAAYTTWVWDSRIDTLRWVGLAVSSMSLIAIFWLAGHLIPSLGITVHAPRDASVLSTLFASYMPWLATRYDAWLDLGYIATILAPLLMIGVSIVGWWILRGVLGVARGVERLFVMPSVIVINTVLLALCVEFGGVASYEQLDYAIRLLSLLPITLFPLLLVGFGIWWDRVADYHQSIPRYHAWGVAGIAGCLFAILTISAVYSSYPKHDAFTPFRGYSVSQSDIDTVTWIHDDAHDTPYVVLASQMLAAAAIRTYGFAPYYSHEGRAVFYYTLPTSPLNDAFLSINTSPRAITANNVGCMLGVARTYFVVSPYQAGGRGIIDVVLRKASLYEAVGDNHVFRFDASCSSVAQ